MNCPVHRARMIIMLLIIFLVCIIIFLSLLCQFVSHLYFTRPIELVFYTHPWKFLSITCPGNVCKAYLWRWRAGSASGRSASGHWLIKYTRVPYDCCRHLLVASMKLQNTTGNARCTMHSMSDTHGRNYRGLTLQLLQQLFLIPESLTSDNRDRSHPSWHCWFYSERRR